MSVQILGLKEINGPLVVLDGVKDVGYDEMAELVLDNGTRRTGRVVQIDGERVVLQVFEGTSSLALNNTRTSFRGGRRADRSRLRGAPSACAGPPCGRSGSPGADWRCTATSGWSPPNFGCWGICAGTSSR